MSTSAVSPPPEALEHWWRRPFFWLVVMVVAFFAISFYFGVVAFDNLQTKNSTDAGIITQAVASALHGKPAPFYESYDCMHKGRCSFLLVHPGLVLYAAVPFFALYPSTLTLFALRSAVVALAALPLYWLTRQVTRSAGKALLAAGLLLVWAPLLAGDVFSLHLESLLPLELFSLAALWQARRYHLGLAVAGISFLTFEIYAVFTFLLGLFFLMPFMERAIRDRWVRWRSGSKSDRSWFAEWGHTFRAGLGLREVRYTCVLLVSSVVAFLVLQSFMNVWGYEVLGVASPASLGEGSGFFFDPSTPPIQSLSTILASAQTVSTAEYWLILYALVGFLPLLCPRALVLSVPWIGYTFLTDSSRFDTIGSQYTMIAAAPIFVALAYGLASVPSLTRVGATKTEVTVLPDDWSRARKAWRRNRARVGRGVFLGAVVAVVVANVLLMPIDPTLPDLGVKPQAPFAASYFVSSWMPNPAIAYAEKMVAVIPSNATVLAPSPYFPLVADIPKAYVLVSPDMNFSRLPFNVSAGPKFVLTEPVWFAKVPSRLAHNLSDPQVYGMRGYVGDTSGGPLLLYEQGYTPPATRFGPALPMSNVSYFANDGIDPGPLGRVVSNSTVPSGSVIVTLPGFNRTGELWTTTSYFLPPGNYTVQVQVALVGTLGAVRSDAPALRIAAKGVGPILVNATVPYATLAGGNWTNLSFNATLSSPLPNLTIDGTVSDARVALAVASVSIRYDN